MKLSIAEVERQFSAQANHSLPDMMVRDNYLGKAGRLSRGGRGPNAPVPTRRDFARIILGIVSSRQAKTVVAGFERTRALKLAVHRIEVGGVSKITDPPIPYETSLEDALLYCLNLCATDNRYRLVELKVEQSEFSPQAVLALVYREEGASAGLEEATSMMCFVGPPAPEGRRPNAIEYDARIREHALKIMVDLYALSIQPEREDGPPAGTGEPVSFDNDDLMQAAKPTTKPSDDLPRATTPTATDDLSKSSVCVNELQPRSKSHGRSSGESPLPPTEIFDDDPPYPRPDPVAAPAA
jgi:hypothetical protein